ncbi:hypothetical protein [Roseibium sediminis]|uniref:hypothetical protein n=1 Tax=Roseibium sediminis TaxID=1775174 RepID=UPI00123CB929|nr:hypothetical protein [Roseibium sediminis]
MPRTVFGGGFSGAQPAHAQQGATSQLAQALSQVAGLLEGLINGGYMSARGGMGSMYNLQGLSQGLRQISNFLTQITGGGNMGGQFVPVMTNGGGNMLRPAFASYANMPMGQPVQRPIFNAGAGFNGGPGVNGKIAVPAGNGFGVPVMPMRMPVAQNGFAPAMTGHNHAAHQHAAARPADGANRHAAHGHAAHNTRPGHHAQAAPHAQGGHNHNHGAHQHGGAIGGGHEFYSHVRHMFPAAMAPTQQQYGGYYITGNKQITGRSPITGLQPVIEQAVAQVKAANRNLTGEALEAKIANKLTNLNDWTNLTPQTQQALIRLTGTDFGKMSKAEREKSINHLLHSPLPFGDIKQPLTKDWTINLGFTHTLDKTKTKAEDLGNGFFRISMISNNNNGSHTGHSLGSFVVQLDPGTSVAEAKKIGNKMVTNTNNNNKLYLDEAARNYLYA